MAEDTTHFYLSTACLHDEHVHCRLTCKFCDAIADDHTYANGPVLTITEPGRSVVPTA